MIKRAQKSVQPICGQEEVSAKKVRASPAPLVVVSMAAREGSIHRGAVERAGEQPGQVGWFA